MAVLLERESEGISDGDEGGEQARGEESYVRNETPTWKEALREAEWASQRMLEGLAEEENELGPPEALLGPILEVCPLVSILGVDHVRELDGIELRESR